MKKVDPLFEETVPVFVRFLTNLDGIIVRGSRFASSKKNKLSEKKLLGGRLAPDMYNFIQQVGYAYFMALETAANLTGKQTPELGYDETSAKELRASLKKVIAFLKSIKPEDVAYSERKKIKTFLKAKKTFSREVYVRELAMPNFFFHVTTAYDIFRHQGVPLTKTDYLGLK